MARDDSRGDHYSPVHPAKRLGYGRISGRVERYDPYAQIDSYRPDATRNGGSYRPDATQDGDSYRPNSSRDEDSHHPTPTQNEDSHNPSAQLPAAKETLFPVAFHSVHPSRKSMVKTAQSSKPGPRKLTRKQERTARRFGKKYNTEETPNAPQHTKKERLTNPSTRIASLRKQLTSPHGDRLPPPVKIEKERELAGLIFEQQKDKLSKNRGQMISRYHRVRFFERKKAERKLKQKIRERRAWVLAGPSPTDTPTLLATGTASEVLRRAGVKSGGAGVTKDMQESEADRAKWLEELNEQVRRARIDLAYAIYSPLTDKYIGLFADDPGDQKFQVKVQRNHEDYKGGLKKADEKFLSEEQRNELGVLIEEKGMDVLRMADKSGLVKPPGWYVVERVLYPTADDDSGRMSISKGDTTDGEAMDIDPSTRAMPYIPDPDDDDYDPLTEPDIKKNLDFLREGRLTSPNAAGMPASTLPPTSTARFHTLQSLRTGESRSAVESRISASRVLPEITNNTTGGKRARPAWLDEDDDIPAEDLDPPSDEHEQGFSQVHHKVSRGEERGGVKLNARGKRDDNHHHQNDPRDLDSHSDSESSGVELDVDGDVGILSGSESESDGAGGFFER